MLLHVVGYRNDRSFLSWRPEGNLRRADYRCRSQVHPNDDLRLRVTVPDMVRLGRRSAVSVLLMTLLFFAGVAIDTAVRRLSAWTAG